MIRAISDWNGSKGETSTKRVDPGLPVNGAYGVTCRDPDLNNSSPDFNLNGGSVGTSGLTNECSRYQESRQQRVANTYDHHRSLCRSQITNISLTIFLSSSAVLLYSVQWLDVLFSTTSTVEARHLDHRGLHFRACLKS
jgi:hypothetical protein